MCSGISWLLETVREQERHCRQNVVANRFADARGSISVFVYRSRGSALGVGKIHSKRGQANQEEVGS